MPSIHPFVPNREYKLNQVEDAVRTLVQALQFPADQVSPRIKRLRDADRAAGRRLRPAFPAAFQKAAAGGRGNDAVFTPYDAFAVWLGWSLLNLSYSQTQSALILRAYREELEGEHRRILKAMPKKLVRAPELFGPGRDVLVVANPAFLVINAGWRQSTSGVPVGMAHIIRGQDNLYPFLRQSARANSVMELDQSALLLHHWLEESEPSRRGRAA